MDTPTPICSTCNAPLASRAIPNMPGRLSWHCIVPSCPRFDPLPLPMPPSLYYETVDHPAHYKANGIEVIDIIRAFKLNFSLGNALKYVLRAGRKPGTSGLEDLKKARWYLDEEISAIEKAVK